MWKEILINLSSLLYERVGKFIFAKTRCRIICRRRLQIIVEKFSDCIEYNKTCSLTSLISGIQQKINNPLLSVQLEKARLLREWFNFYKNRINSIHLKNTKNLFDEFAAILITTHAIFREFTGPLDESLSQKLRRDEFGYPTFRKIYDETTNDFEKLCREVSEELKEIRKWSFLALPGF
jgi:hypothetical protein